MTENLELYEGGKMDYKIIDTSKYLGKLTCNKMHTQIRYYTKKQIKSIYPNNNFRVVGEIGNKTGVQCGVAENLDGQPLPVYKEKTHNIFTERAIGFVSVDDNIFILVVKNVLIKRMMILAFILAFIGAVAIIAENYYG